MNLRLLALFRHFLKDRFNLKNEQDDSLATIASIEKGVSFRGINLWLLVFAIFVASVGLNVNSAAVIIGAMLISPLMGPIMGLGLSVGIYDFELFKRSLKNLIIAVVISILTATLYFMLSPLNEAQSELLSRTTPTIYDVLIALFGGLAGIVAGASKEKGNAIPGVAIATALMPPLCTAGFGLASGNLVFFLGALYLFFINTVMISLSTFLVVRFLKFPLKQLLDPIRQKKVRQLIYVIVFITVVPSIYFAYMIVKQTIFERNALNFIQTEINFDSVHLVSKNIEFSKYDTSRIELILTGETLGKQAIESLNKKLPNYSLNKTILVISQNASSDGDNFDMNKLKANVFKDLYEKSEVVLKDKDEKIRVLEQEILKYKANELPVSQIAQEIMIINQKIEAFSTAKTFLYNEKSAKTDTIMIAYLSLNEALTDEEKEMLEKWIAKRLSFHNIVMTSNLTVE